jgi:UDP-N-acetylmuramoylalanine--D-glutamate ligase
MKDKKPILVLGLGKTGVSVVKYLLKKQESFCIFDQHKSPSGLIEIQRLVKKEDIFLEEFKIETLSTYGQIIVSPGIKPNNEVILKSLNYSYYRNER